MTIATTAPTRSAAGSVKWLLPLGIIAALAVGAYYLSNITLTGSETATGIKLKATEGQGATLTISELEPGDSASKTVTIRNSGAEDSRLSFEENAEQASFANGDLRLRIEQD